MIQALESSAEFMWAHDNFDLLFRFVGRHEASEFSADIDIKQKKRSFLTVGGERVDEDDAIKRGLIGWFEVMTRAALAQNTVYPLFTHDQ